MKPFRTYATYTIRDNSGKAYEGGQAPLSFIDSRAEGLAQHTGYVMNIFITDGQHEVYAGSVSVRPDPREPLPAGFGEPVYNCRTGNHQWDESGLACTICGYVR